MSDPNSYSVTMRVSFLFLFTLILPLVESTGTIPAFPEEGGGGGCPLNLSDEHYEGIKSACVSGSKLQRSRCCPVLAAWLYSAYSATALSGNGIQSYSHDMPLLPDDSETCVTDLGKALETKGIQLVHPNDTCDLVYCYCGIRLHPFTCSDSFVFNQNLKRLEMDCLSTTTTTTTLRGCSKCLHTLYSLRNKSSNSSKSENRTTKIHNKDCELMGLTWLLAKNRTAYINTVSGVLGALMLSTDGSDPQSCTLNSDGMPLAVDSSEMSDQSSSNNLQAQILFSLLFLHLLLGLNNFIVLSI